MADDDGIPTRGDLLQIEDYQPEPYTVSKSDDPSDEKAPFLVLEDHVPFLSGIQHEEEARSICGFLNAGVVLRTRFIEGTPVRYGNFPAQKPRSEKPPKLPRFQPKLITQAKLTETRKPLRDRHGQRGQALLEFALILPVVLALMLGSFDMLMCASAKSSLTWVTEQTATCSLAPSCNVAQFSQASAAGVSLNPAQLNCTGGNGTVTCVYTYQAFGFVWPSTLNLSATATAAP